MLCVGCMRLFACVCVLGYLLVVSGWCVVYVLLCVVCCCECCDWSAIVCVVVDVCVGVLWCWCGCVCVLV